jgi:hypothetical protein
MSAIITNNFRKESCKRFIDDVISSGSDYFIGLGKTDKWPDDATLPEDNPLFSVPLPNGTIIEDADVLDNLISLVKVSDQKALIPRNEWKSGRKYKVYDPYDPKTFDLEGSQYPSYITVNNNIYVCLDNKNDNGELVASTESPYGATLTAYTTFDTDNHVRKTSDSYVWAFLQNNDEASPFYTPEFIPVNVDLTDFTNARAATGGLLYNFNVETSGTGLDSTTVFKLTGIDVNGNAKPEVILNTDSRFALQIGGGNNSLQRIDYVDINDVSSPSDVLTGYFKATVQVYNSNGTLRDDVVVRPLIAPLDGFGSRPMSDLPSFYAGCYSRFTGTVDGEALVDTPIRQISLVKNPERSLDSPSVNDDGASYEDENALDAVNYIQFAPGTLAAAAPTGSIILQTHTGSDTIAYVDGYDTTNDRIYYHSNSSNDVNYIPFSADDDITVTPSTGGEALTYTGSEITGLVNSEYVHNTGKVMFVDHRKKIVRNIDQTEDIKIVIQF